MGYDSLSHSLVFHVLGLLPSLASAPKSILLGPLQSLIVSNFGFLPTCRQSRPTALGALDPDYNGLVLTLCLRFGLVEP